MPEVTKAFATKELSSTIVEMEQAKRLILDALNDSSSYIGFYTIGDIARIFDKVTKNIMIAHGHILNASSITLDAMSIIGGARKEMEEEWRKTWKEDVGGVQKDG